VIGIAVSATTNGALDRLERLVKQYPDEVQEGAYDVLVDAGNALIDRQLVQNPAPFTGRRDWQSERQRRAYFATGGFGRGIPSTRTGEINDAWELGFDVQRSSITVTLFNVSDHYRFVVGSLRMDGPDTQQRMHKQGGWKPVAPIIDAALPSFRASVLRRIRIIPKDFV